MEVYLHYLFYNVPHVTGVQHNFDQCMALFRQGDSLFLYLYLGHSFFF